MFYTGNREIDYPTEHGLGLRDAYKKFASVKEDLLKDIQKIEERKITDPITGADVYAKFATASQLQRLLMKHCGGLVAVETRPISISNNIIVEARCVITTEQGLYLTDPKCASKRNVAATPFKTILEVESRAIRLALRGLGLRIEDEYISHIDDIPEAEKVVAETKPVEEEKASKKKASKKVATKAKNQNSTDTAINKNESPPEKTVTIKKLKEVDRTSAGWPDKEKTTYKSTLKDSLRESMKSGRGKGLTVTEFIKQVLGTNVRALDKGNRLSINGLMLDELEKLYQYYIIDQEEI